METRTIKADRPEVVSAAIDRIHAPIGMGYIGKRFFPGLRVRDVASTLYHKTLDVDASAQTGRGATASFERAAITNGSKSYSALEKGKVYQIPETDVKKYGSIEAADRIGVTAACRSVYRKHETDAAAKLITTARYNDGTYLTNGQVLKGLQTVAISLGRYYGNTVLAGSTTFFQNFVASTDVAAKISAMIGNGSIGLEDLKSSIASDPKLACQLLRAFLPFDEVLVGEDTFWAPSGKTDVGIVARLPKMEDVKNAEDFDMLMREVPVFGATPWYYPDEDDIEFKARSFFDEDNDCNVYKAKGFYDLVELNAAAVKCVKLNVFATTTTSTTTTTAETTTTTTTTAGG